MKIITLIAVVALSSCAAQPTEQQHDTPGASAAPAVSDRPPSTEAAARADALLDDMRRREAAYQKVEREAPRGPSPDEILRQHLASQQPVATPVAAPVAPPAAPAQVAPSSAAQPPSNFSRVPERDETWWKDRMRTLRASLDQNQLQLAAAERSVEQATLRLTQDQAIAERNRLRAAVAADLVAIERLEEEARRAGIPPGWLRP